MLKEKFDFSRVATKKMKGEQFILDLALQRHYNTKEKRLTLALKAEIDSMEGLGWSTQEDFDAKNTVIKLCESILRTRHQRFHVENSLHTHCIGTFLNYQKVN